MSSRPFSFNIAPKDDSKPSPFSPSPGKSFSGGGLFSPNTSTQFASSPESPDNQGRSLFAGATPASKASKFANNGGIFGSGGAPKAQFAPPVFGGFNGTSPAPRRSALQSPGSQLVEVGDESFMSSTYEDDTTDSTKIFEDDSRGEPTMQDEEDDTGAYGDEEDYDESMMNDTLQGDSMDEGGRKLIYSEGIGSPAKEPGQLIIQTEELMDEMASKLYPRSEDEEEYLDDEDMDIERPAPPTLEMRQQILTRYSRLFLAALHENIPKEKSKLQDDLKRTYRVMSLALPLHHSTANTAEVLRKWLHTYYPDPSSQELNKLKAYFPNYVLHAEFWDYILRLVLRGEVHEVAELLNSAQWHLLSAEAGGEGGKYSQEEILAIKDACAVAEKLMRTMPGRGRSSYQPSTVSFPQVHEALDSPGTPADWRIWRGQVVKALEELKGIMPMNPNANDGDETEDSYYGPSSMGAMGGGYGFGGYGIQSRVNKRVKCPGEISRGLRTIYEIMAGEKDAILVATEQQWYNTVVSLFIWTREVDSVSEEEENEEDELTGLDGEYMSMLLARRKARELARLQDVVEDVVSNENPLDRTNQLEVMMGGTMADDESLCTELASISLLAASVLVEIGGAGGWIQREPPTTSKNANGGIMDGFNEDELEVLGMDTGSGATTGLDAEDVLREYASSLFGTEWLDKKHAIEGWEFGVGVLGRVKNGKLLTSKLLSELPLSSVDRVDKLLQHCTETDLPTTASNIAYSWATTLKSTSSSAEHGPILHYLSLASEHAHAREDMHKLVTSLVLRTLSSSSPYPADSDLDTTLTTLLTSPASVTSDILRFELAGYGALRSFYTLRTSDPAAATAALIAVIRSAGEGVDGGVWDPEWEAPVEPSLLPLLWKELLPFMEYCSTKDAIDVAKGITDLMDAGAEVLRCVERVWEEQLQESWVDVRGETVAGVVKKVRLGICKVMADRWVNGED